ncbi:hypothetical protein LCGC14_0712840 [marine sediment metagenome]|uniref:Uncharacterized protein n=1 Tax=marine sediment metagenome TaxID=412755 RepID=A0A0F9QJ08_9ZZZZ
MKPSLTSRKQLAANLHEVLGINQRLNTFVKGLLLEYGDDTGRLVVLKSTFALLEQGDYFSTDPQGLTEIVFKFKKGRGGGGGGGGGNEDHQAARQGTPGI